MKSGNIALKKIILLTIFFALPSIASSNYELEQAKKALSGDYQTQRNLAYDYGQAQGRGTPGDAEYIPHDDIRACAWRKVILLSHQTQADSTDYANEAIDCKKVSAVDNQEVWKLVWTILKHLPQ